MPVPTNMRLNPSQNTSRSQLSTMKSEALRASAQQVHEAQRVVDSGAELSAAKEKAAGWAKHTRAVSKRCEELQRALIEQVGREMLDQR